MHLLDLLAVAKSFGFSQPPKVRCRPLALVIVGAMPVGLIGRCAGILFRHAHHAHVCNLPACGKDWHPGWMMQKDRAKSEAQRAR